MKQDDQNIWSAQSVVEHLTSHPTNFWRWQPSERCDLLVHTSHPHYTIDHARFKTPENLMFWLGHLSDKTWITKEDLVVVATRFFQKNYPEDAHE